MNHLLDGVEITHRKRQFWGLFGPKTLGVSVAVIYAANKINNGDSENAAAGCNAPDWSVSHYIVRREKSAPCDAAVR